MAVADLFATLQRLADGNVIYRSALRVLFNEFLDALDGAHTFTLSAAAWARLGPEVEALFASEALLTLVASDTATRTQEAPHDS